MAFKRSEKITSTTNQYHQPGMNNKLKYELTITEKLEQLSVPDAVDAIWARIEATLDLDMPTDEGPNEPPAGSPSGPGFWFGAVFLVALLSVVYFVNNKDVSQESGINISPVTPAVIQAPEGNIDKPPPLQAGERIMSTGSGTPADTALTLPVENDPVVDAGTDLPLPRTDSAHTRPPIEAPLIPVQIPDTVPKKSRGVKGIKDGDYRIEPTNKNNR
jgi:hypothetical protein